MIIKCHYLKDIKKVINYITEEGKEEIEELYGKISTATGTILRKIIELEQQEPICFLAKCHLTSMI
jgi:DeoR/GlpR family transcriptional regulator of sugar metabolism